MINNSLIVTLGAKKTVFYGVISIIVAVQFTWDLIVPNGLTEWIWYFVPIYLSIYAGGRRFTYLLVGLISFLILFASYYSPAGIDLQLALTARLIGIAALWLMAVIIAHYKNLDQERQRLLRTQQTSSSCNSVLVRAASEPELLKRICRIAVEQGGYRMCWVGFAQNDAQKTVSVAACAGCEDGYLEKANITWSDQDERGRGPTGLAIRSGKLVVCSDFQNDERTAPWWAEARQRGYFSSITIPLFSHDQNFGVLVLYAGQRNAFFPDEIRLLAELADDLAFGIHAIRTRAERQLAQMALEESRSRMVLATEVTGIGFWEWNVLSQKIRWDAQMFQLYGIAPTPDGVVDYEVWRNAVLPEDLAQQEAMLQALVRRGGTGSRSFRIRRVNDGACRQLEAVESVRKNAGGEVEWVFGTNLDVTERMQAEMLLQASEARLKFLVSNTPAIIYSLRADPHLRVTFISPNTEKILGYAPEKFTGDPGFWFNCLHPEDAAKLAKGFFADAASTAEVVSREYRFRHADGRYRWMRDQMRAVHKNQGQPDEFIGHWFDITEQKEAAALQQESELRFENLFAQHKACKMLIEPATGRIRNANAAAVDFYGWPVERLQQMRIQDINLLPAETVVARMAEAKGLGAMQFEFRHRLADGSVRDVEVFSAPVKMRRETLLYSIVVDITERKRAEAKIIQTRDFYLKLLQKAPALIWRAGLDAKCDWFNETWLEFTGRTLAQEFGDGWAEGVHLEDLARCVKTYQDAFHKREPFVMEYRLRRHDGEYRWILDYGRPIDSLTGEFAGYLGFCYDINERRQAEDALRASEAKFQNLFTQNKLAMLLIDPRTGDIRDANPGAAQLYGWPVERLKQMQIQQINGVPAAEVITKMAELVALGGTPFERKHFLADGSLLEVEVFSTPIQTNGETLLYCIVIDISKRKRAEESSRRLNAELEERVIRRTQQLHTSEDRMNLAFRAAQDGIWDWNMETDEVFYSSRYKQMLGYEESELEPHVSAWKRLMHPDDLPGAVQVVQDVLAGKQDYVMQFRMRHKDGRYVDILSRGYPVRREPGRPIVRIVGTHSDLTERKQAEDNLRQSEARLRLLFDESPDAYFLMEVGDRGRISACNKAAGAMLGGTIGQILGKTPAELSPLRQPDGKLSIAGAEEKIAEVLVKGIASFEWVHRRLDGQDFWAHVRISLIHLEGRQVLLVGWRDISDRKQAELLLSQLNAELENRVAERTAALRESEERLRAIGDNLPESFVYQLARMPDGVFKYLYLSRGVEKMLGLTPEAVKNDASLILKQIEPEFQGPYAAAVEKSRQTLTDFEMELKCRNQAGELHWMRTKSHPSRRADGATVWDGVTTDITGQKYLEEALRSREEIYSSIVNQAGDAIALVDSETFRFAEFNRAAHEMLGYTREEFEGFGPADIEAQQSPQAIRQNIKLIVTMGSAVFETRHRHRNGTLRDVRVSSRSIRLQGKNYIAAIWGDITENRRRDAELRKLSLAVEQNPSSIVITDPLGRIEYVNHRFTEVTGYASGEVLGQNPRLLKSGRNPAAQYAELWREITAGRDWRGELINRKKDGSFHVELVVISPVKNGQGQITHFVAMKEDITERKRIEEVQRRLATAVEQSAENIVITDTDGNILYVNPAFEKVTGYTRAEALGKTPRILKSGKQDDSFYRDMWDRLVRGEIWKGHLVNQRKDGSIYEEDATISPIRDEHGRIVGYVAVKHDVTRELQLEKQFYQAQKMEAMGTLAGGIAHDFNNILTVIFGYCYMLQLAAAKTPATLDKVAEILKACNRAKSLVDQILTFSRQHEQKREVIRLETVVKEATKFLRASLPASIKIDLDLAADAPAVLADPTQIYQVVMNLATNALHAMEGQPGRLTVKLDAFTPGEVLMAANPKLRPLLYARLMVADTGHGMDARTLERVFEPFFTTKPLGKGTGLGMALVHGIVQSHDGVITVDSQVGRGTTFALYFPAQIDGEALADSSTGQFPMGRGQKILVLDDEVIVTDMLRNLLAMLHYQTAVCNHPGEALALIAKQPGEYDLVLTDLTMPDMNGLEFARRVSAICPGKPIILSSGFTATLTSENMKEAGICALLKKPVVLMDLAKALHQHLS